MSVNDVKWRIEQLAAIVSGALRSSAYEGQASGRIRQVPDTRTIRYYTTLGILDRPVEMRGRTAYYGPRHVLQLVAIKRLQARGLSLVEVQQHLAGADDGRLSQLAALPADFFRSLDLRSPDGLRPDGLGDGEPSASSRSRFWAAAPSAAKASEETVDASIGRVADTPLAVRRSAVLRIDRGASLVLEGVDASRFDRDTLSVLEPAIAVLCRVLRETGLVGEGPADVVDIVDGSDGEQQANEEGTP